MAVLWQRETYRRRLLLAAYLHSIRAESVKSHALHLRNGELYHIDRLHLCCEG